MDPGDAAPAGPAGEPSLHTFELTIWERAEHWRFYDTVRATTEAEARTVFAKRYGKGYRLEQVHCNH